MFLGIDVGTTSTKAVLMTEQLQVVAEGSAAYRLHLLDGGGVEQNPEDWWEAVCGILQDFWSSGFSSNEVKGICVSGHGCSLVVMDPQGKILRPAISSLDTRSQPQAGEIRHRAGNLILQFNGNDVGTFNFESKLLWLKQTEPQNYEKMYKMMSATGYINYKLTGEWKVNISDLGIAMSYDRSVGKQWNREVVEAIGADIEKFPDLYDCSEIIGGVHAKAAKETGLSAGTPVLAGGEDTSSAALSIGVNRPGLAYVSMGTQCTVGVCTDQYAIRPEILGFPHVLEGLQLISGSMSTCGAGIQWFVNEFCKDFILAEKEGKIHALRALDECCASVKPGANGLLFLPYLSGELHPVLDAKAAGAFFGLRLEHTRAHMGRAVMEGSAHAIAHNLAFAQSVSGNITELRATGGPARSPVLCQAIADITGRKVTVITSKSKKGGAPLGNAILAMCKISGRKIGTFEDELLQVEQVYEPDPLYSSMYAQYHALYKGLYVQMAPLFHTLYEIKNQKVRGE